MPSIRDKMETLDRVGLGYIHVGQQATTLSGGEAQRVKLSKELSKRATGRTLYILDEPTTGLHFDDVAKLLDVLHELVEQGNTVVVIEHNLEVIKTADWIIDLADRQGEAELHRPVPQAGAAEGAPLTEGARAEASRGGVEVPLGGSTWTIGANSDQIWIFFVYLVRIRLALPRARRGLVQDR